MGPKHEPRKHTPPTPKPHPQRDRKHVGGGNYQHCADDYDNPVGRDRFFCMCSCCHIACGLSRFCSTKATEHFNEAVEPDHSEELRLADIAMKGIGNPCAVNPNHVTEARIMAGDRCIQVCLDASNKNTGSLRESILFDQGWCGDVGFDDFLEAGHIGTTLTFTYVRDKAALAPESSAAVTGPGASYLASGVDFTGMAVPPPPPPPVFILPNATVVNPCAALQLVDPTIRADATKVHDPTCTQVCLPDKFSSIAPQRGIEINSPSCVDRGYTSLANMGRNGEVQWYVFTNPMLDAAASAGLRS